MLISAAKKRAPRRASVVFESRVWIVVVRRRVIEQALTMIDFLCFTTEKVRILFVVVLLRHPRHDCQTNDQQSQPERTVEEHGRAVNLMTSDTARAAPGVRPCAHSQPCARRSRRAQPRQARPSVRPRRSAKAVCASVFMLATS